MPSAVQPTTLEVDPKNRPKESWSLGQRKESSWIRAYCSKAFFILLFFFFWGGGGGVSGFVSTLKNSVNSM